VKRWIALLTMSVTVPVFAAPGDLVGRWEMTMELPGTKRDGRLVVEPDGSAFKARWGRLQYEGTPSGDAIQFRCVFGPCGQITVRARGTRLEGEGELFGAKARIVGQRPVGRREGGAKTFSYEPDRFSLQFSGAVEPVLNVFPGDTVRTWTLDAAGRDSKGAVRSFAGNPQTGPFFVEGAMPGDTLAVRFTRIRTNRSTAFMNPNGLQAVALAPWTLRGEKAEPPVSDLWNLDAAKGIATPADPPPRLKNFSVRMEPMLGGAGVAPPGGEAISAGDLGYFGGNLDYRRITEGVTLYLPVYQRGALLFIGDGHAAQGDGELSGQGLETSMDVEFTVDVIENQSLETPWAENDREVMVMGIQGSLTLALQHATSAMTQWLRERYKLSNAEVTMVIGSSMRYDIAEVIGGKMNVVARLEKSVLSQLPPP
jgi:acetamidase/formamidase